MTLCSALCVHKSNININDIHFVLQGFFFPKLSALQLYNPTKAYVVPTVSPFFNLRSQPSILTLVINMKNFILYIFYTS